MPHLQLSSVTGGVCEPHSSRKMAGKNSLDEEITTSEAASRPRVEGHENIQGKKTNKKQDSEKSREKDKNKKKVPFYKLFTFADSLDQLLMFVGTIACIGSGISLPLMSIIVGDIIDAFGVNLNTKQLVHEVSKVIHNKSVWFCHATPFWHPFGYLIP